MNYLSLSALGLLLAVVSGMAQVNITNIPLATNLVNVRLLGLADGDKTRLIDPNTLSVNYAADAGTAVSADTSNSAEYAAQGANGVFTTPSLVADNYRGALSITNSAPGSAPLISGINWSNTTPAITITANGNLGLNFTTPSYPIDMRAGQAIARFSSTNAGSVTTVILGNTSPSAIRLGIINFDSASGTPGQIEYSTNNGVIFRVSGSERVRFTPGGNVGIGTTTPSTLLHVAGTLTASNIVLSVPAWKDHLSSPTVLSKGGTATTREKLTPLQRITVEGWPVGAYGDGEAQLNHDAATTNAAFPEFYIWPHIHISSTNVTAALTNSAWRLDYNWTTISASFVTNSLTGTNTVTNTFSGNWKHELVNFALVTNNAASGTISSIFTYTVERVTSGAGDVGDTTGITRVHDFDIHYPVNRLGSSTAITY